MTVWLRVCHNSVPRGCSKLFNQILEEGSALSCWLSCDISWLIAPIYKTMPVWAPDSCARFGYANQWIHSSHIACELLVGKTTTFATSRTPEELVSWFHMALEVERLHLSYKGWKQAIVLILDTRFDKHSVTSEMTPYKCDECWHDGIFTLSSLFNAKYKCAPWSTMIWLPSNW